MDKIKNNKLLNENGYLTVEVLLKNSFRVPTEVFSLSSYEATKNHEVWLHYKKPATQMQLQRITYLSMEFGLSFAHSSLIGFATPCHTSFLHTNPSPLRIKDPQQKLLNKTEF